MGGILKWHLNARRISSIGGEPTCINSLQSRRPPARHWFGSSMMNTTSIQMLRSQSSGHPSQRIVQSKGRHSTPMSRSGSSANLGRRSHRDSLYYCINRHTLRHRWQRSSNTSNESRGSSKRNLHQSIKQHPSRRTTHGKRQLHQGARADRTEDQATEWQARSDVQEGIPPNLADSDQNVRCTSCVGTEKGEEQRMRMRRTGQKSLYLFCTYTHNSKGITSHDERSYPFLLVAGTRTMLYSQP